MAVFIEGGLYETYFRADNLNEVLCHGDPVERCLKGDPIKAFCPRSIILILRRTGRFHRLTHAPTRLICNPGRVGFPLLPLRPGGSFVRMPWRFRIHACLTLLQVWFVACPDRAGDGIIGFHTLRLLMFHC